MGRMAISSGLLRNRAACLLIPETSVQAHCPDGLVYFHQTGNPQGSPPCRTKVAASSPQPTFIRLAASLEPMPVLRSARKSARVLLRASANPQRHSLVGRWRNPERASTVFYLPVISASNAGNLHSQIRRQFAS